MQPPPTLRVLNQVCLGLPVLRHPKKIDALDNWRLRSILHIHWTDFVSNDAVRSRTISRHTRELHWDSHDAVDARELCIFTTLVRRCRPHTS